MKQEFGPMNRVDCGAVQLTNTDWEEAMSWLCDVARVTCEEKSPYACFCEANLLAHAIDNAELRQVLQDADVVFADGIASLKLAKIYGYDLPERIPGPTFMLKACEQGIRHGWRHFFYGGAPGVAEKLAANLKIKFPGLQVAGTYSPPFRSIENLAEGDMILKNIEDAETDILWVGLGGPKQEFWMAQHCSRISVPIMLGVGAAFDFHSGTKAWAPRPVRVLGLEWLFRMFSGGWRTTVRNARSCSTVGMYLLKAYLNRSRNGRSR